MTTIFERREFNTGVYQRYENRMFRSKSCVDVLPIKFFRWKTYADHNPDIQDFDAEPATFLFSKVLKLRFSRERASGNAKTTMERLARYQRVIAGSPREANKLENKLGRYLTTTLGIHEDDQPFTIVKIMEMLRKAVPDKVIEVHMLEMTFRSTNWSFLWGFDEDGDDIYYRAKLVPAPKSFIESLEEVRLLDDDDNLELLGLECPICMQVFADTSITRLPCSHYYHRDCIVQWLQINHVCPTCRHPNAPMS
ncbi:putative transcription factor C2H2 family [Rosa chinensis]|uniref:RING-type E3 ubiquitin transferase n=1 Tax=Rosa chinensis TaxID=74649 RepID=A0A2P6Q028_ROSCH|nr:uncharacterized protein LOC121050061 [Rosa chinensis]PRQ27538.1 putative transcription factor C2H2 family [Rosa chinensis]